MSNYVNSGFTTSVLKDIYNSDIITETSRGVKVFAEYELDITKLYTDMCDMTKQFCIYSGCLLFPHKLHRIKLPLKTHSN